MSDGIDFTIIVIEATGILTSFFIALSGFTGVITAQKPSKRKYVYYFNIQKITLICGKQIQLM